MSEHSELGECTQNQKNNVDETSKELDASRARVGGKLVPAEVAREVENASHLRELRTLAQVIDAVPGLRVMMIAEAIRGMGAMIQCWSHSTKSYEEKIDYPTRQKAIAWLAGYSDGLPVQTNLNGNLTPPKAHDADPADMMTPAGIEATERMLARAKKRLKQKSEAIEVGDQSQ